MQFSCGLFDAECSVLFVQVPCGTDVMGHAVNGNEVGILHFLLNLSENALLIILVPC